MALIFYINVSVKTTLKLVYLVVMAGCLLPFAAGAIRGPNIMHYHTVKDKTSGDISHFLRWNPAAAAVTEVVVVVVAAEAEVAGAAAAAAVVHLASIWPRHKQKSYLE